MFHALAGRRLLPKLPRPLLRLVLGLPRRPVRRAARLAAFPTEGLPVERPVTIRWNEQLVPYVEAETDRDLAVALGAVHAHLREGQMDFLRLLAQGRLSEVLGPFAREVDHALRIVDFGRAVPEMERRLPPETRAWIEGYCAGLNHHRSRACSGAAGGSPGRCATC
jgi:penicillin amidase